MDHLVDFPPEPSPLFVQPLRVYLAITRFQTRLRKRCEPMMSAPNFLLTKRFGPRNLKGAILLSEVRRMVRSVLALTIAFLLSGAALGQHQQIPGIQLPPLTLVARPCLMGAPQILLFTAENRYHQVILFNTCTYPVRWSTYNPFPFIRIDASQAANPIPPGQMTPLGVYVDWTRAPSYAIPVHDPTPILDWLEQGTGKVILREGTLYLAVAFVAFCEGNTPARACIPVLIFLMRAET